MPTFTPEQLAQIQALLAKNSSPQDDSDDAGSALAQAMKPNTTATPTSDDSTPAPAKVMTPGASADWSPGQPPVDASNPVADVSQGIPQPNGGMNPQQLAAEIASNPGPIATTGTNPNNSGPDDKFVDQSKSPISAPDADDSDDDEATPAAKAVVSPSPVSALLSKMQAAQPTPQATSPGQDPNAALNQLVQAQKQAQANTMLANLGKAGETIASGFSRGAYKPNDAFYDGLTKQAQAPVEALQAQQAFKGTQTEQALKNYALADEQEKNDPNSGASNLARSVLTSSAKQAGMNLGDVSKLSASTIEKTFPSVAKLIDTQQQALTRRDIAEQNNLYRQSMLGNKQDQQQQKTFNQTGQQLEQMRGSPAVAQAEKDLYSSQKANSLATMYGDPNKLSQSQVQLLAAEVGKIAAGGVSSDHALQGITPNSFQGRMSQYTTNLTNNPTAANAAAFVKQFQDYTGALAKDAQGVITDRYGRILNDAKKSQLTPDQYSALKTQYLDRFAPKAGASPQSSGPASAPAQQSKPPVVQNGHTYIWNPTSGKYE